MAKINLTKEQSCFHWKIVNFAVCPQLHNESICSPRFSLDSSGITNVSLHLYPRGTGRRNKCICVKLIQHKSEYRQLCKNKYKLNLNLSENGKIIDEKVLCIDLAKANKEICWTWPNLLNDVERNFASEKRKNDVFLSSLDICLIITPMISTADNIWDCKDVDIENLSSNLAKGLNMSDDCDLLIKTNDGSSFKAHKAIISSRYPSLAEALELHENQTQEFLFRTDCETLQVLLKYLYSGKMETTNVPHGVYDILNSKNLHHLHNFLFPIPMYTRAITTVRTKKCSFTWALPNFTAIPENAMLNYTFCCDENLQWTKMRVRFCFIGKCSKEQWIAFSVQRLFAGVNIHMLCKIGIVNDILGQRQFDHIFQNETEWKAPCFISKQFLIDRKGCLLPEDILRIKFEFKISDGMLTSEVDTVCHPDEIHAKSYRIPTNLWILQQDLLKLYRSQKFSDVTLRTGKERFPAHKSILSLRSLFFCNIFQRGTLGENSDVVTIKNFDPEVIQAVLSYIYSGEVNRKGKDFEFITKLHSAAHEYELPLLKQKCATYLHLTLNLKNAGEILLLADNHLDHNLKKCVQNFVRSNLDDILSSREWRRIIGERLHLEEEVLNIS